MILGEFFNAARTGDERTVLACLQAGADVSAMNEHGFAALHCAAIGANAADNEAIANVMKILIEAGSPLEMLSTDGRTPLYLAAEFAKSTIPIQCLIDAGADADIIDKQGNHIVENAMLPEVKALLSSMTGFSLPSPTSSLAKSKRLTVAQWRDIQLRLDRAFETLKRNDLIALQDAGFTQEDGFSDCSEVYHDLFDATDRIQGFCFYTRQDLNRAKHSRQLYISFWGAPEGRTADMKRVASLVVSIFRDNGLTVDWDGSADKRLSVLL